MSIFKKFSVAFILAVAAVFTATAANECKSACNDIKVPKKLTLDKKTSDGIFAWYKTNDGRRFLKYVHNKPATIFTPNSSKPS